MYTCGRQGPLQGRSMACRSHAAALNTAYIGLLRWSLIRLSFWPFRFSAIGTSCFDAFSFLAPSTWSGFWRINFHFWPLHPDLVFEGPLFVFGPFTLVSYLKVRHFCYWSGSPIRHVSGSNEVSRSASGCIRWASTLRKLCADSAYVTLGPRKDYIRILRIFPIWLN